MIDKQIKDMENLLAHEAPLDIWQDVQRIMRDCYAQGKADTYAQLMPGIVAMTHNVTDAMRIVKDIKEAL